VAEAVRDSGPLPSGSAGARLDAGLLAAGSTGARLDAGPVEFLEREVLPALFNKLPEAFPEFGFRACAGGWKATNEEATRRLWGVRADRVQAYANTPFGVTVHGRGFATFVSLEHDGGRSTPRGAEFIGALKRLAAKVGVDASRLDREMPPGEAARMEARHREHDLRETYHQLSKAALAGGSAEAAPARAYLAGRGFDAGAFDRLPFGLHAPKEIGPKLLSAGYPRDELRRSGLFADSRWRGRVVFPLRDERGRIASFAARDVTGAAEDSCKYLYLAGARKPPFFGLEVALRDPASRRRLVIVEGPFDAIRAQILGFPSITALGGDGSQLGPDRYALLARLGVRSVVLALDFDPRPEPCRAHARAWCIECSAGARGTISALDHLAGALEAPRVYVVRSEELHRAAGEPKDASGGPAKVDVDDLLRLRGVAALEDVVRRAVPGVVYRGTALLAGVTPESPCTAKEDAVLALASYLESCPRSEWSKVHEDELLLAAAERTGWSAESIEPVFVKAGERARRDALARGLSEALTRAAEAGREDAEPGDTIRELRRDLTRLEARALDEPQAFSVERLDRESAGLPAGKPSGWTTLDALGVLFGPGELAVVAGRTGHCKTTALVCILENMLETAERSGADEIHVLYSAEEPEVRVYHRLLAVLAAKMGRGWTVGEVGDFLRDRRSRPSWPDPAAIDTARERLRAWEERLLVVHRPSWTVDELAAHAVGLADTRPVGAVLCDYLQRIPPPEGRYDRRDIEVSLVARRLKSLAVDAGVPVIAGAQINRQAVGGAKVPAGGYPDPRVQKALRALRPKLHHLREGGSEQEADLVLGLMNYRADFETDESGELREERFSMPDVTRIDLGVLKSRYGPPGRWAALAFEGRHHLIRDPRPGELA
jgi:replicative DNA helicase